MRLISMALAAALMMSGCTAKEFNQGVNDGVEDVKRVIRGENS